MFQSCYKLFAAAADEYGILSAVNVTICIWYARLLQKQPPRTYALQTQTLVFFFSSQLRSVVVNSSKMRLIKEWRAGAGRQHLLLETKKTFFRLLDFWSLEKVDPRWRSSSFILHPMNEIKAWKIIASYFVCTCRTCIRFTLCAITCSNESFNDMLLWFLLKMGLGDDARYHLEKGMYVPWFNITNLPVSNDVKSILGIFRGRRRRQSTEHHVVQVLKKSAQNSSCQYPAAPKNYDAHCSNVRCCTVDFFGP